MQTLSKIGGLTLLCIASLTIMVGTLLAPGLISIAAALGVADTASWLITLPSLGAIFFAPFAGRLIDRFGAYRCLIIGLFLYGFIGTTGVFLHGSVAVFTNRIALGAVTALVMAGGTVLISEWYSGRARLRMITQQGMSIELGGVIFLFLGGLLATLGWRWPFALYLISWFFLLMLLTCVPAKSPPPNNAKTPEDDHNTAVPTALKVVYLAATIAMTVFFTAFVILPTRLHALAFSEAETGYFLSFISLVAVGAAMVMPRVSRRLGERNTLALAFTLYTASHTVFYLANSLAAFVLGAGVIGTAFGLSIPLVTHMTVELSHSQYRGRNLSYLTMAIFLGQFMASMMELLPGGTTATFCFAAILACLSAFFLIICPLKRSPLQI
ncbi:MFS transporter [Oceanisphaera ostreae]|uniref:MFS transporter n=1 Tax=Oceanisphaera ostreae TaxID=914151 RepID=A0ABW3KNG2_9GAMM